MDVKETPVTEVGLSARALHVLQQNGIRTVGEMLQQTEKSLLGLRNAGLKVVHEILEKQKKYRPQEVKIDSVFALLQDPKYHSQILEYVRTNDLDFHSQSLSARAMNRLTEMNMTMMSDLVFSTRGSLCKIPGMGINCAEEIVSRIRRYLTEHENRILAVCRGDMNALTSDEAICDQILELYKQERLPGMTAEEIAAEVKLPEFVTGVRIQQAIDDLVRRNELFLQDDRYCRTFDKFTDVLQACPLIDERSRYCLQRKLEGKSMATIGRKCGLSRERIRQLVEKAVSKVAYWHRTVTGKIGFAEDYYKYFCGTYAFDPEIGTTWFEIPDGVYAYLDTIGVKPGKTALLCAAHDENLSREFRTKVQAYLTRSQITIDGGVLERKREALEQEVARRFCQDEVTFPEFIRLYNNFISTLNIPHPEELYCTEATAKYRKGMLPKMRFLLWKQNSRLRYYDIDGQDYTELLETLNLDSYENVDLSTQKFMENCPEIMKKYDIRDQYELHNLLRKIIPEGSYHDFRCGRMPIVSFGTFEREKAIREILLEHSPITSGDLGRILHQEYGYDPAVALADYMPPFRKYFFKGMFRMDQKEMSEERMSALKEKLTEDFYYMAEVQEIYSRLFPDADLDELNAYNLKRMGFVVQSGYILQNYPNAEAYCRYLFTNDEVVDLVPIRKRLSQVQAFYAQLALLKAKRIVIETERGKLTQYSKLEKEGLTKKKIQEFCDAVYNFIPDDTFFSIQTLMQDGFKSDIFKLGFTDRCYANILGVDPRFAISQILATPILYKGDRHLNAASFIRSIVEKKEGMTLDELGVVLRSRFGCSYVGRALPLNRIIGSEIYFDQAHDRLYSNWKTYAAHTGAAVAAGQAGNDTAGQQPTGMTGTAGMPKVSEMSGQRNAESA